MQRPRALFPACVVLLLALSGEARALVTASEPETAPPAQSPVQPEEAESVPPKPIDTPETVRARAETARSAPALVVSGGISLGAYQAGFIATLVRFWSVARRDGADNHLGDPTPRVWTGASAGAVNALLGGVASCDPAFAQSRWAPEESLFWKVWIDQLDLDPLLPKNDDDRTDHLFSDTHMKRTIALIGRETGKTRFLTPCSFAFGLTVTNLKGRDVPLGSGGPEFEPELKRVTEKLVVQVHTSAQGELEARLPVMEGARDMAPPYIQVNEDDFRYYPSLGRTKPSGQGGQDVPIDFVLNMPRASGAFPFAFRPVDLPVSFFEKTRWMPSTPLKLVDGGFLNNNPLDLAVRLGQRWREEHQGITTFNPSSFSVVYLDQDVVEWDWKPPPRQEEETLSPLESTYFQHAGSLASAAQASIVLNTMENEPSLTRRLEIPRRSTLLASEFQFAMMGFFDRRFREHDFYRGMQDAIHFLATRFRSTTAVESQIYPASPGQAEDPEQQLRAVLGIASPGFQCVAEGDCSHPGTEELRKLRDATNTMTAVARDPKQRLEENDLDTFLRLLKENDYRYSPGVMKEARATGHRQDLQPARARIGKAFHDMVTHQKGGLRLALRPVGAAYLDEWLTYTPPQYALTLHVSRQRGVGLGVEAPLLAYENRSERRAYNRAELRLGTTLSGFGVRDMDQLVANRTRLRWLSLGAYVDWVSDLDGFSGKVPALKLGPFVRWRVGVGGSVGYLSAPHEFAVSAPEVRVGLDLMEMLGVRLTVPLYSLSKREGQSPVRGFTKVFKEAGVGAEVLLTRW